MIKYWQKIPILIRALVVGLFVSTLGITISGVVYATVPLQLCFVVMAVILVLYWKYFTGSWWPESTKEIRRIRTRTTERLSSGMWMWGLVGAGLIVLIEQAGLVFTFRLMEFPADLFIQEYAFLQEVPRWAGWMLIIFISLVAGVCEELGFRGYMQQPLETKYGPLIAITITSIVFVIVHLHQAWSASILIHIFLISALFGFLAYATQSIIPGIIGHFVMDIFNFSFWWSDLFKQFDRSPISTTGMDSHFLLWTFVLVLSLATFAWLIRRLIRMANTTDSL